MIDAERFESQCQFEAANGVELLCMHLDTKIMFKSTREHRFSLSGGPRLLLNEDVHCLCKMAVGDFRNQLTPNLVEAYLPLVSVAGWYVDQQRRDNPDWQARCQGLDHLKRAEFTRNCEAVTRLHFDYSRSRANQRPDPR